MKAQLEFTKSVSDAAKKLVKLQLVNFLLYKLNMNELSCKTFLDIRNDLKRLDVITEHDYIFANTIEELCSVRDGEFFIDINISIVNKMICQLCII